MSENNNLKNINLDDIPKFDQRKNFLEPNKYLAYFESIADLKSWSDNEKSIKLISKVEPFLQSQLIEKFKFGWMEVRKKFLETKIETRDYIGNLEKKFSYEYNLEQFLIEKKIASKQLAQKSSDDLFVEAVRRSLPINYQWIDNKEQIEKDLPHYLKEDKKIFINAEKIEDQKTKKKKFKKLRFELLKKAYELSVNCDCQIALICFDSEYKLSQYANLNIDKVLTMYVDYEDKCFDYFTNKEIENAINKIKSSKAKSENVSNNKKLDFESIIDKFNELVVKKEPVIDESNDLNVKSNLSDNKTNEQIKNFNEKEMKQFYDLLDLFKINDPNLINQLKQEDIVNLKKYFSSPNDYPKIELIKLYYDLIVEYQSKDPKYFLEFFNQFLIYYSLLIKINSLSDKLILKQNLLNDKKPDNKLENKISQSENDNVPKNQINELATSFSNQNFEKTKEIKPDDCHSISSDSIEFIEENEILELTENCESLNMNENFGENSKFELDNDE